MSRTAKAILGAVLLAAALGAVVLWRSRESGARKRADDGKDATVLTVFLRVHDQATAHAVPNILALADRLGSSVAVDTYVLPSTGDAGDDALARCAAAQGGLKALHFVVCRQSMGQGNDDWSACAEESAIDKRALDECAKGSESASLAKNAAAEATRLGVTSTPTVFVAGRRVEGDATREALRRAICEAVQPAPQLCTESTGETPAGFPILVLTDARCAECRAPFWFRRMQMLFPSADIRIVDVQTEAGRRQFDALTPGLLPAIALDPRVESDPGFARIRRELVKKGEHYFLSPDTVHPAFDPTKNP